MIICVCAILIYCALDTENADIVITETCRYSSAVAAGNFIKCIAAAYGNEHYSKYNSRYYNQGFCPCRKFALLCSGAAGHCVGVY